MVYFCILQHVCVRRWADLVCGGRLRDTKAFSRIEEGGGGNLGGGTMVVLHGTAPNHSRKTFFRTPPSFVVLMHAY